MTEPHATTAPPELFPEFIRAGYHVRPGGRTCPRGHAGLFRDARYDCAECRKLEAPSWRLTRTVGKALAAHAPIPSDCAAVLGAKPEDIRAYFALRCRLLGVRLDEYGTAWAIYHRYPLASFDLASATGFRAANALDNLEPRPPHNAPRNAGADADRREPCQLWLFPPR